MYASAVAMATRALYDGVHYRASGEVGAARGRKIGEHVLQHHLQPRSLRV